MLRKWLPAARLLASCSFLLLISTAVDAASVKGRIVDSAGKPVAGAEVRIWQKLSTANAAGAANQPVLFDGRDALATDAEGRFASPDVLVDEAFAFVVAEADGMLAGRSGWIELGPDGTAVLPDIVLVRLRTLIGQVVDREGSPIAGATVFNSGDGHQRVAAKTGRGGKFLLAGLPDGPVFLFAEKPGYRFSGMRLPAGQANATFTLALTDDAIEPLATLPPLYSPDEEDALAREVLDPWLDGLAQSGTDMQKAFALASLASVDPLEGFDRLDSMNIPQHRPNLYNSFVKHLVERPGQVSPEKLRTFIELGNDPFGMARQYADAARLGMAGEQSPNDIAPTADNGGDEARWTEWFDAGLLHARRVKDPGSRTIAIALIADALLSVGERTRAETALAEAEQCAESLPENLANLATVHGTLAVAAAASDADRAVRWLEKIKSDRDYLPRGTQLALRLVSNRPDLAEDVWDRSQARARRAGLGDVSHIASRYGRLADFCYRMAAIDLPRADRVAAAAEHSAFRIRGQAAIALALAEEQPAEARRRLEKIVREDLPAGGVGDAPLTRWWSPPTTAAWLLPIAESVAPDLGREIFWRSLALRSARPRRDQFDGEADISDMELAKMLARYDRDVARAVFEPIAARLGQITTAAGTRLESRHAFMAGAATQQPIRDTIVTAVHVDARWAKELQDAVVSGAAESKFLAAENARQSFTVTIVRHGPDRWQEGGLFSAAFWKPSAD